MLAVGVGVGGQAVASELEAEGLGEEWEEAIGGGFAGLDPGVFGVGGFDILLVSSGIDFARR